MTLRVGTILRLPWWTGSPRAVVVGFVRRAPSRVRLLGLSGVIRGRVMLVRLSRIEKRAKPTRDAAHSGSLVPCPCSNDCGGRANFSEALGLLRRLA